MEHKLFEFVLVECASGRKSPYGGGGSISKLYIEESRLLFWNDIHLEVDFILEDRLMVDFNIEHRGRLDFRLHVSDSSISKSKHCLTGEPSSIVELINGFINKSGITDIDRLVFADSIVVIILLLPGNITLGGSGRQDLSCVVLLCTGCTDCGVSCE